MELLVFICVGSCSSSLSGCASPSFRYDQCMASLPTCFHTNQRKNVGTYHITLLIDPSWNLLYQSFVPFVPSVEKLVHRRERLSKNYDH